MKVLLAHNCYRSGTPAGEDNAVRQEEALLRRHGIEVVSYRRSNDDVDERNPLAVAHTATNMAWSSRSFRDVGGLIRRERPDVAHFHNTFPLISPSGYAACRDAGVPVVQTLHNYRLLCMAATNYRDGAVCEKCGSGSPWPGLIHRCYRRSVLGSAAVGWMLWSNWHQGRYTQLVDAYVALTQFAADRFVEAGLPAMRMFVKPNFVDDSLGSGEGGGGYVIFASRFSEEKGIRTLLEAWRRLRDVPLKLVGDGPMRTEIRESIERNGLPIEIVGMKSRHEVLDLIGRAEMQVVPSEWFEGFPLVIVEAYARGTPVVAAKIGGLAEVVVDGVTGLLHRTGDPEDLARCVRSLWTDAFLKAQLRRGARAQYEANYTPEQNFRALLEIYEHARTKAALRGG